MGSRNPPPSQRQDSEADETGSTTALTGEDLACVTSEALFGTANVILIEHNGEHYRLRRTRQNKLILTK